MHSKGYVYMNAAGMYLSTTYPVGRTGRVKVSYDWVGVQFATIFDRALPIDGLELACRQNSVAPSELYQCQEISALIVATIAAESKRTVTLFPVNHTFEAE